MNGKQTILCFSSVPNGTFNMPNDPQLPPELQHLLEKRDVPNRRKATRRKEETPIAKSSERRVASRRSESRRKKKG